MPTASSDQRRHNRRAAGGDDSAELAGGLSRSVLGVLVSLDSFVGREAEKVELRSLLGSSRLVTVTGPPGVGKSRLTVEVASTLLSRYPDGVVQVPLGPAASPAMVATVVASAVGVGEQPGRTMLDTLADHLGSRRVLLFLDNCEHVVAGVARVAEVIVERCPAVTVVATSQMPLGAEGETCWGLDPLPVPQADADVESVATAEATQLFCDRAGAICPGFALTPELAPAVGEICRRLDGLPLALELAAARVVVLTPVEIAHRLGTHLDVISGLSRTPLVRHQSVRAAVDWSHRLCTPAEQAALRRLSVFAGGATLGAAAEVCGGVGLAPGQVFDTLSQLAARSLVVLDTKGDETRYSLLHTVGAYAHEQLEEAGEAADVMARHGRWCASLAESAEAHLTGRHQLQWLRQLDTEHGNLRIALERALERSDAVLALRLAAALALFWRLRGHFSFGWYLDSALELDRTMGQPAPPVLRAKALWGVGLLAGMLGNIERALRVLDEAFDVYRDLGDQAGAARSLLLLANCRLSDPGKALPMLHQCAELARSAGDGWCLAHALGLAALAHLSLSQPDDAGLLLTEAVAVAEHTGDAQGWRIAQSVLGQLAVSRGDHDAAQAAFGESLSVTRELHETYGAAVALIGLAEVSLSKGDSRRARLLLDQAAAAARTSANPALMTEVVCLEGRLAHAGGDLDAAQERYHHALTMINRAGLICAVAQRGLGELAAERGDLATAARLFDQALEVGANQRETAAINYDIAELCRRQGEHHRSVALHHQALTMRHRIGDKPGIAESLEAVASLAADSGPRRAPHAVSLLAAARALRETNGYAPSPGRRRQSANDLDRLQTLLTPERFREAWTKGSRWSLTRAVNAALKGPSGAGPSTTGWPGLTKRERQVAALAAEGFTRSEIAARLNIAPLTVKGHLANARAKMGEVRVRPTAS